MKKFLTDLALIVYDDLDFHAMSLPRLAAALLTVAVFVSWVSAQFFGFPFEDFSSLTILCAGVWGSYSFKKFTERNKGNDENDD